MFAFQTLCTLGLGLLALRHLIRYISNDRKIQGLGGHAPISPTWVPFGIGRAVSITLDMLAHRHYETFKARLNWKEGDDRHTVERSILSVATTAVCLHYRTALRIRLTSCAPSFIYALRTYSLT